MGLSGMDIADWIYRAMAVLFALSVHEYAHAYTAYRLGDQSQKYLGRLTLNPMAHLDPIGTLLLLVARVGWARPVQVNPLKFKNPRQGMIFVSLAGPVSNLFLAFLFVLPYRFGFGESLNSQIQAFLVNNVIINVGLAAFNIIPIPPLDGSKVLSGLLPRRQAYAFDKLEVYGPVLLIVMVTTGMTSFIFNPIFSFLLRLVA